MKRIHLVSLAAALAIPLALGACAVYEPAPAYPAYSYAPPPAYGKPMSRIAALGDNSDGKNGLCGMGKGGKPRNRRCDGSA